MEEISAPRLAAESGLDLGGTHSKWNGLCQSQVMLGLDARNCCKRGKYCGDSAKPLKAGAVVSAIFGSVLLRHQHIID